MMVSAYQWWDSPGEGFYRGAKASQHFHRRKCQTEVILRLFVCPSKKMRTRGKARIQTQAGHGLSSGSQAPKGYKGATAKFINPSMTSHSYLLCACVVRMLKIYFLQSSGYSDNHSHCILGQKEPSKALAWFLGLGLFSKMTRL